MASITFLQHHTSSNKTLSGYLRHLSSSKRSQKGFGPGIVSACPIAAAATMQSTLKLTKGDRVDVWKPKSGALGECVIAGGNGDAESLCHHFTGWLLGED